MKKVFAAANIGIFLLVAPSFAYLENMCKSLQQKARESDGRRHCDKCEFFDKETQIAKCSQSTYRICSMAYQQGFKKGYKTKEKEINESK